MQLNGNRAQASIDMLISYSVAILIVSIAIYVVLQLGIFNTRLAPTYCNSAPSFICSAYTINNNGILTFVFSQSTDGTINITGVACSSAANTIASGPKFGNVNVLSYDAVPQYYPSNALSNGLIVYSSNQTRISIYCYNPGGIAKGGLGNTYTGLVWINYKISELPSNLQNIQQIISFTAKYS